jgi:hypothetical protein
MHGEDNAVVKAGVTLDVECMLVLRLVEHLTPRHGVVMRRGVTDAAFVGKSPDGIPNGDPCKVVCYFFAVGIAQVGSAFVVPYSFVG